ncbi:MAG: hypothetical protein HN356_01085 [Calditrichaeota bacterium]|jgi:hypothetical protein|nr:hypothetical protein [Calditrichota bacterium]
MKDVRFMWQKRLSEAFSDEEHIIGRSVLTMREIDKNIELRIVEKYQGYDQTIHAFIEYWYQTLSGFQESVPAEDDQHLLLYLSVLAPSFGRFRQSWEVFLTGHYFDAISMLRSVYQTVLIIAADQDSNFDFLGQEDNIGQNVGQATEEKRSKIIHKGFVSLEKEASRLIVGNKSDLKQVTIQNLEYFLRIIHKTVHPLNPHISSNLRVAFNRKLSLFPEPDDDQLSQYLNISNFIGWMTLRVLSLFNRHQQLFNDDWMRRTKALDEAFETLVEGFAELEKPIGEAIIELIDKKFSFNNSTKET